MLRAVDEPGKKVAGWPGRLVLIAMADGNQMR
jgi:hypothetical protein